MSAPSLEASVEQAFSLTWPEELALALSQVPEGTMAVVLVSGPGERVQVLSNSCERHVQEMLFDAASALASSGAQSSESEH